MIQPDSSTGSQPVAIMAVRPGEARHGIPMAVMVAVRIRVPLDRLSRDRVNHRKAADTASRQQHLQPDTH